MAYAREVASRLQALLEEELVGVYGGGSLALGDYQAGRSDLDVAVVCRDGLTRQTKEEIVGALRHEALACPARGLELVVYAADVARSPSAQPGYELDLNTGPGVPFRAAFGPDDASSHWYGIDRAIVREHGIVLYGPPPRTVFGEPARDVLLALVSDSVRWHEASAVVRGDDAVLNACRAWRFAETGQWSSKSDAGKWACMRLADTAPVEQALEARRGGPPLDRELAQPFLREVRRRLQALRVSS